MMRLKHLFRNDDLARMLFANWDIQDSELSMFRISANAIYRVQSGPEAYFMRFAPDSEKRAENVRAEIEFMDYLKKTGFGCAEALPSVKGRRVEEALTPWGRYSASIFREVPGSRMDRVSLTHEVISGYGRALGRLHRLSCEYEPAGNRRWSWKDVLGWILSVLCGLPSERAARQEVFLLGDVLSNLSATRATFGLIHFDFELDNVFFDVLTGDYYAIDFDDAMYHWYVMDIEQSVESLKEAIDPREYERALADFISGYRAEFCVTDEHLRLMPVFRRFADLYTYARVLRSLEEKWDNEPEWMLNLRCRLERALRAKSASFGLSIRID